MDLKAISGGYKVSAEHKRLLVQQRAITKAINERYVQVGAIYLSMSGKDPFDKDWFVKNRGDTDLQSWIDDEAKINHNVGFNLQLGWMDIDIDADDPEYNKCILAALTYLGVDSRFRFGRMSVGVATHVFVQLSEEESKLYEQLRKFEPKQFRIKDKRYHCQLRSYPTAVKAANLPAAAKQTVVPGSIYSHKKEANTYDISVWYSPDGGIAPDVSRVASTTPRKTSFNDIIRAITFGTALYLLRDHWVEGSRQIVAGKVSGWLARVVAESQALNNHESVAKDVYCPVDDDTIADKLLHFICKECHDEEPHMRVRTYYDAKDKLERNPDAKIPGWPSIEQMLGGEATAALRTVFMPGSDVSQLTKMAERYIYDETDNKYIDRERHSIPAGTFVHAGEELERRHRGDVVRVGGKPREAFKVFESSDMRKRVAVRNFYPNLTPGAIYRIGSMGEVLSDDDDTPAVVAFNTWRGWSIRPCTKPDRALLKECVDRLDKLLGYITRDNPAQVDWIKQWLAWTFQNPGTKQQIALVMVGGQGVGKSFFGARFVPALMGDLWGAAAPKVLEGGFSVEPFIDKMTVFIDEAKFHSEEGTDEIKKLIRSVKIGGAEKFQSAKTHNIYSRIIFASNRFDMNIGQANTRDRALFYTKTYDKDFLNLSENDFRDWAETLKPWFDEFDVMLNDRKTLEHFMYYFMNRKVNKHEIESIKHSSSGDSQIVANNMTWARKIAKYIVEDGRIHEDIDISYPFTQIDLNRRVLELCKDHGLRPMNGERVMAEFKEAGLVTTMFVAGRAMVRFTHKHGDLVTMFGNFIGTPLDKLYEFKPEDFGEVGDIPKVPPPYKGARTHRF